MTHKLANGEFSVTWTCPHCHTEQNDSVHPTEGPYVSCTCGTCGRSFSDENLDEKSLAAWEIARDEAERTRDREDDEREIPLDTPSLDTSFHDHEMDID